MSAHDNWLAGYRHHTAEAYCHNPECAQYGSVVWVDYQEEYGAGWITPEECTVCRGGLSLDAPSPLQTDTESDTTPTDDQSPYPTETEA